jgi:hypothetical protein
MVIILRRAEADSAEEECTDGAAKNPCRTDHRKWWATSESLSPECKGIWNQGRHGWRDVNVLILLPKVAERFGNALQNETQSVARAPGSWIDWALSTFLSWCCQESPSCECE